MQVHLYFLGYCEFSHYNRTMIKDLQTFGYRLKQERIRIGLPQSHFATAGRVSQATLTAYEAGTHVPNLEYLNAVSLLGVDPIFVISGRPKIEFVENEFNWELLGEIIEGIFNSSELQKHKIPVEKQKDLLRFLYRDFSRTGLIDVDVMNRWVRIARDPDNDGR